MPTTTALTRGAAVIGAIVVVSSTFLVWSTGVQNVPRRIYTYQPGPPPGHSLWHASAAIAIVTIAVTLLSVATLSSIPSALWARLLPPVGALVVLAIAVACWIRPPGAIVSPGSGLGEALTLVGAVLLLVAGSWTFRSSTSETRIGVSRAPDTHDTPTA